MLIKLQAGKSILLQPKDFRIECYLTLCRKALITWTKNMRIHKFPRQSVSNALANYHKMKNTKMQAAFSGKPLLQIVALLLAETAGENFFQAQLHVQILSM